MTRVELWNEMVLLSLDEFAFLSAEPEEHQIPEKIIIDEIEDSVLLAKVEEAKVIFKDHLNSGLLQTTDLSYVDPLHKIYYGDGKHQNIKIHKKDIANYYKNMPLQKNEWALSGSGSFPIV